MPQSWDKRMTAQDGVALTFGEMAMFNRECVADVPTPAMFLVELSEDGQHLKTIQSDSPPPTDG